MPTDVAFTTISGTISLEGSTGKGSMPNSLARSNPFCKERLMMRTWHACVLPRYLVRKAGLTGKLEYYYFSAQGPAFADENRSQRAFPAIIFIEGIHV